MTRMPAEGREHGTDGLVHEVEDTGANAVLAFRLDASGLGATWTDVRAGDTAVRARER